eukprot:333374-Chlamydomonas_euryale.AAC.5
MPALQQPFAPHSVRMLCFQPLGWHVRAQQTDGQQMECSSNFFNQLIDPSIASLFREGEVDTRRDRGRREGACACKCRRRRERGAGVPVFCAGAFVGAWSTSKLSPSPGRGFGCWTAAKPCLTRPGDGRRQVARRSRAPCRRSEARVARPVVRLPRDGRGKRGPPRPRPRPSAPHPRPGRELRLSPSGSTLPEGGTQSANRAPQPFKNTHAQRPSSLFQRPPPFDCAASGGLTTTRTSLLPFRRGEDARRMKVQTREQLRRVSRVASTRETPSPHFAPAHPLRPEAQLMFWLRDGQFHVESTFVRDDGLFRHRALSRRARGHAMYAACTRPPSNSPVAWRRPRPPDDLETSTRSCRTVRQCNNIHCLMGRTMPGFNLQGGSSKAKIANPVSYTPGPAPSLAGRAKSGRSKPAVLHAAGSAHA